MNLLAHEWLSRVLTAFGVAPASAPGLAVWLWRGVKLALLVLLVRAVYQWLRGRRGERPAHLDFGDRPDHYTR